jgi:PAS domain S-box-containing protein
MLKSLRYRLLIWFVLSTILIAVSSFLVFQLHKTTKLKQQKFLDNINFFQLEFLKDQTQVALFLANETTNDNFFISGESDYLVSHNKRISNIDSFYVSFLDMPSKSKDFMQQRLFDIRQTYTNYCTAFDSLVYKIYQRGYKNYGLEGELASYLYQIENNTHLTPGLLNKIKIAESQYSVGNNSEYARYVNELSIGLIDQLKYSQKYNAAEKNKIHKLLTDYLSAFNAIVALDKEIGLGKVSGQKNKIAEISYQIEELIDSSIVEAKSEYAANMAKINTVFTLLAIILIAFSVALSVYTSKYLVSHLEQLIQYISSLAKSNFNQRVEINLRHASSEVRQIYHEFRNMLTDLKIREQQRDRALRISEDNQQRYQELADLLPQCIYETDRMGNLTYVNKAWHDTFGYTNSDVDNGINLIEVLNAAPNSSLFGFSKVENNDFVASRKDGSKFPATVYSDVIKKGFRIAGRRGIIIDSTLRNKYIESLKKETARAVTSDKHKSSFLANMSHEIRTPMNSIIGFTNMLSSKEVPDEMKGQFVNHIQASSEMLLNLIDDIIDIAKIEDGQLKINKADCEPVKLIESLATNFEAYKNRAEKEHLEIRTVLPKENILLKTDKFRLKQIFTNLLSNAIKFTDEGWVEVGMKVKNQRTLEFFVEDTGMGMSREELRTVFERFKRTKLTEEKKISGTGLGLAISKNLVEMLGGNMWVTSEPGKGTCFTFELPYLRVAKTTEFKPLKENIKTLNLQGRKILVAEDDDYSYTYISHILEKTKARIIRAHNGKEVLDAMSFHADISLVLMDLRMPIMNGLETTTELKKKFPKIPVIAQTAFAMEGDRNKCLTAGCDDYITKPINAANLMAKMAQFIPSNSASKIESGTRLSRENETMVENPPQKEKRSKK